MSSQLSVSFGIKNVSYASILKLAIPLWIANIALVGGATIDTMMAGRLGADELAGVAIGMAVTVSVVMTLVGVLQSLSPIAAHHYGAKKFQHIGFELHQNLQISVLLSVIGIAASCYTPFWLDVTNAQGEVARVASNYLFLFALGIPAVMAGRSYISLNAAVSRPKINMVVSGGMVLLKIPFNLLFIYGWGPIPAMGGAGCALSSSMTAWLSVLCFWLFWHYDPHYLRMRLPKFSKPSRKAWKEQLYLGIPIGISTFFDLTSFTFMTIFISRFGPVIVSGHQIASNLTSFCYMLPLAFGISSTVLVSQALGAGFPQLAKKAAFNGIRITACCAFITASCFYLFCSALAGFYTNEPSVIAVAVTLIPYAAVFHFFDSMNCSGSFAMRGYRITLIPMILYGVFLWGFGLGVGAILGFTDFLTPEPMGAEGFWFAAALGLVFSAVLMVAMAIYVAVCEAKGKKLRFS